MKKTTVLLACVLAVAAIAIIALMITWGGKEKIDSRTFCPENGPTSRVVVVYDTSDPFTPSQIGGFEKFMDSLEDYVQEGQLLAVYEIADKALEPKRRFWRCSPGSSHKLSEGTMWTDLKWGEFVNELMAGIPGKEELKATDASSSPIIESIQYVRNKEFPTSSELKASGQTAGVIVLISDMLQNSNKLSHFTKDLPPVEDFFSRHVALDLTGIEIEIRYLKSDQYSNFQTPDKHFTWWRKFFALANSPLKQPPVEW